ncbi:hypothetical protein P0W64_16865 [Tsukamurella sp. 8F]|uniref:hypothetical protein n=1 Tax=unclassified Tsukamurella TaxID=2633480 RepID=UPI0023B8C1E9|nr:MULTISPECIES: hypothetical protein [unclassified Tsukamurella]MDF0532444.1 hypothetical protein [Tsukamurella sp. 8J]MDF0588455.1 hypothetical protein [Tsukamurella sp. 8F]
MLIAALAATVIGFVLLVVALITANMWLAVACVAVSVVGVLLLLGDVLTYRRAERDPGGRDTGGGRGGTAAGAAGAVGAAGAASAAHSKADHESGAAAADSATGAPVAADAGAADPTRGDEWSTEDVGGTSPDSAGEESAPGPAVGHEEFGHHDETPTRDFSIDYGRVSAVQWAHEGAADTDDEGEQELYGSDVQGRAGSSERSGSPARSGGYDPDKTDFIERVEDAPSWGSDSWQHPDADSSAAEETANRAARPRDETPETRDVRRPSPTDSTTEFPRPDLDD